MTEMMLRDLVAKCDADTVIAQAFRKALGMDMAAPMRHRRKRKRRVQAKERVDWKRMVEGNRLGCLDRP